MCTRSRSGRKGQDQTRMSYGMAGAKPGQKNGSLQEKKRGGAVKEKLRGKFRMSISAAHTRQVCWCAGWTATPSQLPFPDLIPPNLMSFGLSHLSTLSTLFRFPILASNIPCVPLYCTAHGSDISGTRLVCCGCL